MIGANIHLLGRFAFPFAIGRMNDAFWNGDPHRLQLFGDCFSDKLAARFEPPRSVDFLEEIGVQRACNQCLIFSTHVWHPVFLLLHPPKKINIFLDWCITEKYPALMSRKFQRGAVSKKKAQPVAVWLPDDLKKRLDIAVQITDLDRSKFIRAALREKLQAVIKPAA